MRISDPARVVLPACHNHETPGQTMLPGMGIIRLRDDQPLDLALSLSCGQAFRWGQRVGWWVGVIGGSFWRVRQIGRAHV